MTQTPTLTDCRTEIDRKIKTVLASGPQVPMAQVVMTEIDDRWYGQLLALSYESVVGSMDFETVRPAAAAVAFLHGYCRLRSEILIQLDDTIAHSLNRDLTTALLAGDYLNSLSYASLREITHVPIRESFQTLTQATTAIVETLYTKHVQGGFPSMDYCSFIDGTVGSLGQDTAKIGATLAGADRSRRDRFARFGRGLAIARQIHHILNSDRETITVMPPPPDKQRLRQHANQRMAEANQALCELSSGRSARLRQLYMTIEECDE